MEEVDSLSVAVSGIDINKVEPLDSRRVVAFINQFLCTSVTFLNQFSAKCEGKLDDIQQKLFKIESKLAILEGKLHSLPRPDLVSAINTNSTTKNVPVKANEVNENDKALRISNTQQEGKNTDSDNLMESTSTTTSPTEEVIVEDGESDTPSKENIREDPRYSKYFKMASVGVPLPAIKLKMKSEGVDPNVLDL